MANTDQIIQLAGLCLAHANQLQKIQQQTDYNGPDMPMLYANEMALRTKVYLLNTAAMGSALNASNDAASSLAKAMDSINNTTKDLKNIQTALLIAADMITLAASVISNDPGSIIGSSLKLATDALPAVQPKAGAA